MDSVADLIRSWTPTWTDDSRYRLLSTLHGTVPHVLVVLFVMTDSPVVRVVALGLMIFTLTSQVVTRECVMTLLEHEFSDARWDDFVTSAAKSLGWVLTRSEKMAFNIGLSVGVLGMMILILMRQSLIWVFPILVLLSLVLLSKGHRSVEIAGPAPESTVPPESAPSAQTPPPVAA